MTSVRRAPVRPNRMVAQSRLMAVINVPMRLILGLPFATPLSRQLMLLHLTGRKSGKRYVQPVSYVPDGNTLLTPGGGRWKLNLKPSECVRLRLRGRDVLARPEFIRDVSEVERLLRRMQSVNPRITSFVPVDGSRGEFDHAPPDRSTGGHRRRARRPPRSTAHLEWQWSLRCSSSVATSATPSHSALRQRCV